MESLETITKEERELCDELVKAVQESPVYGKYRHEQTELVTNYRTGEVTLRLDASCLKATDGRIKHVVCKAVDDGMKKIEDGMSYFAQKKITVYRTIKDDSASVTFKIFQYHEPQTIEVTADFAKGSLSETATAIIRFAEIIASLYKICSAYGTYGVTFSKLNSAGKAINKSFTYGVHSYAESKANFEAYAIAESARLIRECDDETSYDPFIPNYAEITTSDTKDVFKVKF
jgi:hypothetical protein